MTGADVKRIRKKLGLTQLEAGRIFGVGDAGFSRFEREHREVPLSLKIALRLLDKFPHLLHEVIQ